MSTSARHSHPAPRESARARASDPTRRGRRYRVAHAPCSRRCRQRSARRTYCRAARVCRPAARRSRPEEVARKVLTKCPSCPCVSRVARSCSHPTVVGSSDVLPVSLSNPSCLSYRRALYAVLAVPTVAPIHEDEMCSSRTISSLVHSEQSLDRRTQPALLLRVELLDSKVNRRRLRLRLPRLGTTVCPVPSSAPSASPRLRRRLPSSAPGLSPRFVD